MHRRVLFTELNLDSVSLLLLLLLWPTASESAGDVSSREHSKAIHIQRYSDHTTCAEQRVGVHAFFSPRVFFFFLFLVIIFYLQTSFSCISLFFPFLSIYFGQLNISTFTVVKDSNILLSIK